ncbi:LOW QUALITY PROTEIN: hypothetical protein PanWU01x14_141540 [Parasponia andersonii]|uniref:Uncharacterized protein n=1 Tax=Parasponia andersonii TaxID=3476 RepID=A0A2P5CLN6_PARAD|nr:LOW QUALITY PROTEIN: hypothetical protein PanWU01x14_141540 [Parasponia andersonii]
MATQTDRLARIAAEGFAMIDELYGRPRPVMRNPLGQGQGEPHSSYQGNQVPYVSRMAGPVSSQEATKKYGGYMTYKNQHGGY